MSYLVMQKQQGVPALLCWAAAEGAVVAESPSGSFVLPAGCVRSSSWCWRCGVQKKTLLSSWRLFSFLGKSSRGNHWTAYMKGSNLMVCPADEASRARLSPPALSCVTHRAERPHFLPGHPAVYKRSQQPARWGSHFLQDEKGQSHEKWICSIKMSVFSSVVWYTGEKRAEKVFPSWCSTKRSLYLSGIPSISTVLTPVPHLTCLINVNVIF